MQINFFCKASLGTRNRPHQCFNQQNVTGLDVSLTWWGPNGDQAYSYLGPIDHPIIIRIHETCFLGLGLDWLGSYRCDQL